MWSRLRRLRRFGRGNVIAADRGKREERIQRAWFHPPRCAVSVSPLHLATSSNFSYVVERLVLLCLAGSFLIPFTGINPCPRALAL